MSNWFIIPRYRRLFWISTVSLILMSITSLADLSYGQKPALFSPLSNSKTKKNLRLQPQTTRVVPSTPPAFSVPPSFQGKIIYESQHLPTKVIALTFDDGPWPNTKQVLEILQQNQVKATFFWVGEHLKMYPEIAQDVIKAGHAVGNHTWHHRTAFSDGETAAKEIENTSARITKITGAKTKLFRPPAGNLTNGLAEYARIHNYAVIMWSVDTEDWRPSSSVDSIIHQALTQATAGGIILLHDGGGNRSKTIAALPVIIKELTKQGYKFVTIPELLNLEDKARQKPALLPSN